MAKKERKRLTAMNFVSESTIARAEAEAPEPVEAEAKPPKEEQPKGLKANPEYIETKSKRVQLLVQPSLYRQLKSIAVDNGISVNEAISQAIKKYIEEK